MRKIVTPTKTRNNDPMAIIATIQILNSPSSTMVNRKTKMI